MKTGVRAQREDQDQGTSHPGSRRSSDLGTRDSERKRYFASVSCPKGGDGVVLRSIDLKHTMLLAAIVSVPPCRRFPLWFGRVYRSQLSAELVLS